MNADCRRITRSYIEGLCWVLEYYYQGVPAWDWYYPYHYAPFAQDFQKVGELDIRFESAAPFTPFGQLLGVFPAASRIHLPEPLQSLMTDEDSPIIDFYPEDFDIDMNGKKMAWQGVALLPFIDQKRLLDALDSKLDLLTPDEQRRNRWGETRMFVAESNRLYDALCKLYTLKAATQPMPIDPTLSQGMNGSVLADPLCVPNSAMDSPLPSVEECPDLTTNASLAVRYYVPRQKHTHRSVLLRGYRPSPAALTESDRDWTRRGGPEMGRGGGRGRGRGGPPGGGRGGRMNGNYGPGMSHSNDRPPRRDSYPTMRQGDRYPANGYGHSSAPAPAPYAPPPIPAGGGGYGGYGYGSSAPYAAAPSYGGGSYSRGPPHPPAPYGGQLELSREERARADNWISIGYAPPPHSRNPYAPPPPASYGAPPAPYRAGGSGGPPQGGYGGYGGSGGSYGGQGGGHNPYAPPPRRY